MQDFLSMGGYADWVWSAWGLTAFVTIAIGVVSWRGRAAALQRARRARGTGTGR